MHANQPAFFKRGPKPLTRLVIFSALSLALIIGDAKLHLLDGLRQQIAVVVYPLQQVATKPLDWFNTASAFFTRQATLQAENRHLHEERLKVSATAMRVKALEAENAQLRALQQTKPRVEHRLLVKVLYNGRDPFTAQLIVDRGSSDGMKPGQVVIDHRGVAGQVLRVHPLTSEIRLITDRNHMVPVQLERTGLRAVLFGMGRNEPLEVRYMPSSSDIKPGDILSTSGIDGLYPAGLPVARVLRVERRSGSAFIRVYCQPLAEFNQHDYLLAIDGPAPMPPHPADSSAPSGAR